MTWISGQDKLINVVLDGFQKRKGKASCYCFNTNIVPSIISAVVNRILTKTPGASIFVATSHYQLRQDIKKDLIRKDVDKNSNGDKITVLTKDYIKTKYHYSNFINIIAGINDDAELITKLANESRFTLCILTKNIMNNEFITKVRNILPEIDTAAIAQSVVSDNVYSPVEEHRYGVELSDDDRKLYDKYTDYINTSISIFGDLNNIEKCKFGDIGLGISGAEFRNNIAYENGWREDLDTSIPFMKQIDDTYNPNSLFERACNFYNIAKNRRNLVCDNEAKLDIIKDICLNNKDKKILIISKRGEFAAKITKYLNKNNIECGDYHDCIDDAIAVDEIGRLIFVKSGANAGKPKVIGAQAQSTLNERRFNEQFINVLSIKSASNTKLKIACDIVILTSPLCEDIINVKQRFTNVHFNGVPTETYKIYCVSTIENEKLNKEIPNTLIKVINETENFITYNENNSVIVC